TCWYWVFQIKITLAEVFTKRSRSTIVDWYNLCRDVGVAEFQKHKKMGGPGLVVQIDESLFQDPENQFPCISSEKPNFQEHCSRNAILITFFFPFCIESQRRNRVSITSSLTPMDSLPHLRGLVDSLLFFLEREDAFDHPVEQPTILITYRKFHRSVDVVKNCKHL
ncbi:Uncharacterized protein FWK35_00036486, partial [Aphis craccivora]